MPDNPSSPAINFRANNEGCPDRKERFVAVLKKRGANATDVLNNFVDAYIECDGRVTFPVKFVCEENGKKHSRT